VYLDFDTVRSAIGLTVPGKTIPQWLASLGNKSLPTFTTAPTFTSQSVRFADAWNAGYSIEPSNIAINVNAQMPTGALNDLIMTRAATDYNLLSNNCLVTVNGLFHRSVGSSAGLYVLGGGASGRIANDNQVGLLSFLPVGGMTQVGITDAMIYNQRGVELFKNFVYVNLGQSLVGKTLLFVLGGHLHILDDAYTSIGDGLVRINIDALPWPEVFFDTARSVDISTITWSGTSRNPQQIAISDLYSDAVIEAFLMLSQTFFVVVDAENMYVKKHYTQEARIPGRWYTDAANWFPLIGPMNRLIEYIPQWENTKYVLMGRSEYHTNYLFETAPWLTQTSIAPNRTPRKPIDYAPAYLLELGVQTLAA
jgi:hypothetical protein